MIDKSVEQELAELKISSKKELEDMTAQRDAALAGPRSRKHKMADPEPEPEVKEKPDLEAPVPEESK